MDYENEGRVLLLDDERLVRFTISAWLKASNFEVTAVGTPEEACAELKARSYDVVLSDVMMGAVDGFMFRDSVRGFNPTVPIIFLTALVNSADNHLLDKVAADIYSYYVPKNARREFLLGRLRQAVRAYRSEREAGLLKSQMDGDLRIAARVQHALLPPPVRCDEGIFYSGLWRPHSIVSGDLFCWFPRSPDSAVLVFGDIAGHGAPAALAMAAVMSHLKDMGTAEGIVSARPELVCQGIDTFLRGTLRDVTYMAGTVLFVDFRAHRVRYMNAGGIEPICIRRGDGSCVPLNPNRRGGLPMGMMDGTVYSAEDVVEAEIPDDALLFLSSDGLDDLTSDPQGEKRIASEDFVGILGELIRGDAATLDLAAVPYRLSQTLRDLGYTHAHDDMSMFIIGDPRLGDRRFMAVVPMWSVDELYAAVDRASEWATDRGYPDELVAKLELLLCEHLANICKHGLDDDGRRREIVLLEMRPTDEGLEVQSLDRGRPYEGDLSELAPHPDITLDAQNENMADSGRGFAIIRKICRRVAHENFDGLNKFTFVMDS